MSIWQIYKSLTPRSKALVGLGLVAWGVLGLQLTPAAEAKLGLTPSEADKEALERMTPKIHTVPRDASKPPSSSPSSS